jgi:perosamine synthetase
MQERSKVRVPPTRICIPEEDRRAILRDIEEVLRTGALTLGAHGTAFEAAFAGLLGRRYAVAVNSGTSALEIALRILGAEGREVIVPTNTFFATAAAVVHAGGRPRFSDVEPETLTAGIDAVRQALTPATAGVIVVHIGGAVNPETPKIAALCREHGLFLVEDAAHAHGSSLDGRMAGSFGDVAAFSFYPTKVITSGEGGMLVTDDEAIHRQAAQYRDQGKASFLTNLHVRMGYNWRLSELHAVVGRTQLGRLAEFVEDRRRVARVYGRELAAVPGIRPLTAPGDTGSNFYKYPALLDPGLDRAGLKTVLRERFGVALGGEVYDTPCHRQPVFAPWANGPLPSADDVCSRHVCLPIYPGMPDADVGHVVGALAETLSQAVARCA